MVKILLTADWHIDAVTAGIPRVDEIDSFVDTLEDVIAKEGIDFVIHLGDYFNPGGMLCSYYTAKMIAIASRLGETQASEVIFIAGNHDVIETSRGVTTISPLAEAFLYHPNIRIFEKPSSFLLSNGTSTLRGLALPYVARAAFDASDLIGAIEDIATAPELPLIVVGHMTVPGAVLGSETKDMPRGRELDLDLYEISKLNPTLVANGHYHRSQVVSSGVEVVIPGSPFRFTFGERNDTRKGYTIIEIETN